MFALLKAGEEEPDPDAAAEVGLHDEDIEGGQVANIAAHDMLLRMPGVAAGNVHKLMEAAGSLAGLAEMDEAQLGPVIGGVNAKALHSFLHSRYRIPD
jgi:ERCC4-type nuclease